MTTPTPDRTPTGDLCDQLAQEIHLHCPARPYGGNCRCTALATAVLPVVEAALNEQRERAERAEQERDTALVQVVDEQRRADERCTELLEERDEALNSLTDAERQRDEARLVAASLADNGPEHLATIERAEQAEQQRDAALAALGDLTDGRPCAPHPGNGWCQTHGERAPCPHAEARRLLAALDQPEET